MNFLNIDKYFKHLIFCSQGGCKKFGGKKIGTLKTGGEIDPLARIYTPAWKGGMESEKERVSKQVFAQRFQNGVRLELFNKKG